MLLTLQPGVLANALRYMTDRDLALTDAATRPHEQRAAGTRVGIAIGKAREVLAGGCRKTTRCGALCGEIVVDGKRYEALDPRCRQGCWEAVSPWLARGLSLWDDPRQRNLESYFTPWQTLAGAPTYRPAFAVSAASAVVQVASADRVYRQPAPDDTKDTPLPSLEAVRKPAPGFEKMTYVGGVGCDRHSFYIDLGPLQLDNEQLSARLLQLVPTNARSAEHTIGSDDDDPASGDESDEKADRELVAAFRSAQWTKHLETALKTMRESPNRAVDLTRYYGREAVIETLLPEVRNPTMKQLALDVVEALGYWRLSMFAYSPTAEVKDSKRALQYGTGVPVYGVLQAIYVDSYRRGDRPDHALFTVDDVVPDMWTIEELPPIVAPWLRAGLLEHWLQLGSAPLHIKSSPQSLFRLRIVPVEGCEGRSSIRHAAAKYVPRYADREVPGPLADIPELLPLLAPADRIADEE